MTSNALQHYETRWQARHRLAESSRRTDRWLARARRAIAYPVIIYVVFDPTVAAVLVPLVFVIAGLTVAQTYYVRRWRRAARAVDFYARGIDRLNDNWAGRGDPGWRYYQAAGSSDHLYADDLDIFGPGSLFELLGTARTSLGQSVLARWLTVPSSVDEIRGRQAAVDELRDEVDLRERLAVLDLDARNIWPEALERWPTFEPLLPTRTWRLFGCVLAWTLLGTVAWAFIDGATSRLPWMLLATGIVVETIFYLAHRRRATEIAHEVGPAGLTLAALARLAVPFRSRASHAPRLQKLVAELEQGPSLVHPRLMRAYSLLQNPVVYLLAVQLFPALERWRLSHHQETNQPRRILGELEALSAIAAYAYEHAGDPFPELVDGQTCFVGQGVGHPLLPASKCVRNDVQLDDAVRLLIVSGSNMSGKSTLLRAVGINAVLALSGAPVRAQSLRISPLKVCTAMRFRDSLQEGNSYFSTSIKRLKQIIDQLHGEYPLLFLFDEMLSGTNSSDRLAGTEAVLRKLLGTPAIGMLTTHDLALTELPDVLGPTVTNAHCEHQLLDGKITFDYRLRPGVVKKSNAVALMRGLGLDI